MEGEFSESGGGKEIRTPDPELAKLVLYQLSYAPIPVKPGGVTIAAHSRLEQPAYNIIFDAGAV